MPLLLVYSCFLTGMVLLVYALLFIFCLSDPEWYPADEIQLQAVGDVAGNQQRVMISRFVNPRLTLYDFDKNAAMSIDDGRIKMLFGYSLPFKDGFAVVSSLIGALYYLDHEGSFVNQAYLKDISGWQSGFRIKKLSPKTDGTAYVTIKQRDSNRLILGFLDLHASQFEDLEDKDPGPHASAYWICNGDDLYFIEEKRGLIQRIDQTSGKNHTVLPARPLVERPHRERRSPYHSRLDLGYCVNGAIFFDAKTFPNGDSEFRDSVLMLKGNQTANLKLRPLGYYQGQWLVKDLAEGEARLVTDLEVPLK